MIELDDTDAEILRLLLDDARRSYTEIGEAVGLSSPTVSNRVSRLEDLGVIRGFTADVDRSKLATGDAVLVEIEARPGAADDVVDALADVDAVEWVLRAFEPRVLAYAFLNDGELERLFAERLDDGNLLRYEITKIAESLRSPRIDDADLALECVQCEKRIEGNGVSVEMEGRRYYCCCTSCESLFVEEYRSLRTADDEG